MTIPPQSGKKNKLKIEEISKTLETSLNILLIISLVIQSVLKANKNALFDLFLNLQIQKSISYF